MTVYLLLGDDEERKARSVEKLRGSRAADTYDAAESDPEAVVAACNSYSLFGEGPFVLLKNLDAWSAAQKAKIVDYLANAAPEADLVLLARKLGARERLFTALKKGGEVHELRQPTGKALVKWAVGYARKLGLDLPEVVAEDLTSRCSEDKGRLVRETEKLALYVSSERPATLADVDLLCPTDAQSNIFAFVDALAAGDKRRSMALLEDLVATGEPPLRLTYMVRRQFTLVARARALFSKGAPHREVASALKVPPFVARKLEEQGRALSDEELERALDLVLELERGLKGGKDLRDELQVELAVLRLSELRA